MVDADRLGTDEILLMAGIAGRGKALELSDRGAGVALVAVKRGVRANQWEAVQVLIDLLHRDVPSSDVVALLAIRAHLALVNVGVAVGALLADIGKDRLGVALNAAHAFVHAAQRVLGGVVIEFRNGADRFPSAERVTVLARNAEASVRTTRSRGRLRLSDRQRRGRENRKRNHRMKKNFRSQDSPNLNCLRNGLRTKRRRKT